MPSRAVHTPFPVRWGVRSQVGYCTLIWKREHGGASYRPLDRLEAQYGKSYGYAARNL